MNTLVRSRRATTLGLLYYVLRRGLRRMLARILVGAGQPPLPPVPDYLREDVGLPPAPAPRYALDPTILHGWRRS